MVDEGLGVVAAKSLLSSFAEKVSLLDKSVTKNVCEFALLHLLNRTVSFEDQVCIGVGALQPGGVVCLTQHYYVIL